MRQIRCPDCGVEMADVDLTTHEGFGLGVQTGEKREGLLGKLGVNERHGVDATMCPECGLVRLYAGFDDRYGRLEDGTGYRRAGRRYTGKKLQPTV